MKFREKRELEKSKLEEGSLTSQIACGGGGGVQLARLREGERENKLRM